MVNMGQNGDKFVPRPYVSRVSGIFPSVPCYDFSEGTKRREALFRAGLRVFVPCFEYRGQNA